MGVKAARAQAPPGRGGLLDALLVALAVGVAVARSPAVALPWWLLHLAFDGVSAPPALTSWMSADEPAEVVALVAELGEIAAELPPADPGGPPAEARLALRATWGQAPPEGWAAPAGPEAHAALDAWLVDAWTGDLADTLERALLGDEVVDRAARRAAAAGHAEPASYAAHRAFLAAEAQARADAHLRGPVALATLLRLHWPVDAPYFVSSRYGMRDHPVLKRRMLHNGVDIAVPIGTPVLAAQAGRVAAVREDARNGLWVRLDHGNGVQTTYCHLDAAELSEGAEVPRGGRFARSGNSGASSGPHVHYIVRVGRASVDPLHLHQVPLGARGALVRAGALKEP